MESCRTAADKSAEVRLAFAILMRDAQWAEALPCLVELTRDRRDFNRNLPYGWPEPETSEYAVARAALKALANYPQLRIAKELDQPSLAFGKRVPAPLRDHECEWAHVPCAPLEFDECCICKVFRNHMTRHVSPA